MSTIKCDIYRVNFPKKHLLGVLTQLELANFFEPLEPIFGYEDKDLDKKASNLENSHKNLKSSITFLETLSDSKQSKKLINITSKDVTEVVNKEKQINSNLVQIQKIKAEYDDILAQKVAIQNELEKISDLAELDVKIAPKGELFNTKLLKMDVNQYDDIKYDLSENELINFESIKSVDKTRYAIAIYDKAAESILDKIIANKNLVEISISEGEAISFKDYSTKLQNSLDKLDKESDKLIKDIEKLSDDNLNQLKLYADVLKLNIKSLELLEYVGYSFGKDYDHVADGEDMRSLQEAIADNTLVKSHVASNDTLHIDGWVIPESAEKLEKLLKKIDKNIQLIKLDRDKLSSSRSSMKNVRVFQPFETVTGLMGTPSATEIDPSPYVAPFFIAFFGFALGDAGYGIVITLASIYALFKMKLSKEARNGIELMMYCGVSTIIFGALTGGWFGADLAAIGPIGQFLAQFKVFDIASNIILVLIGSLIIGFIHQIFGLLLSMYSHIKNGDVAKALYLPGTWILFLLSIVAFAFGYINNYLLIGVIVVFAWGQGYGTKNPFLRLLKGTTGLFGITSYLSNTLSYARLLALALATGVIASVVNLLASLFSGNIPVVSQLIAIVILVIGHAFNLILNLVGTFINVVRLHLVEFFPHFFDAQGVSIQPLKFDSDYIIIEEDESALDFVLA